TTQGPVSAGSSLAGSQEIPVATQVAVGGHAVRQLGFAGTGLGSAQRDIEGDPGPGPSGVILSAASFRPGKRASRGRDRTKPYDRRPDRAGSSRGRGSSQSAAENTTASDAGDPPPVEVEIGDERESDLEIVYAAESDKDEEITVVDMTHVDVPPDDETPLVTRKRERPRLLASSDERPASAQHAAKRRSSKSTGRRSDDPSDLRPCRVAIETLSPRTVSRAGPVARGDGHPRTRTKTPTDSDSETERPGSRVAAPRRSGSRVAGARAAIPLTTDEQQEDEEGHIPLPVRSGIVIAAQQPPDSLRLPAGWHLIPHQAQMQFVLRAGDGILWHPVPTPGGYVWMGFPAAWLLTHYQRPSQWRSFYGFAQARDGENRHASLTLRPQTVSRVREWLQRVAYAAGQLRAPFRDLSFVSRVTIAAQVAYQTRRFIEELAAHPEDRGSAVKTNPAADAPAHMYLDNWAVQLLRPCLQTGHWPEG